MKFGSSSLRVLASELGVESSGDALVSFLNSPYICNDYLDRIWDANFTSQIRTENERGGFVVFESKVAPILTTAKREQLLAFYSGKQIYSTNEKAIMEYMNSKYVAELNNLFVVCLSGSIDGTIQRMRIAGREEEANLLPGRIENDARRYLDRYGINPYDISLIRDSGVADIIVDTLNLDVFNSVNQILTSLLGERIQNEKVQSALGALNNLCEIGNHIKVKNTLVEDNTKNGLIFIPDVSRVIVEMRSLGFEYTS